MTADPGQHDVFDLLLVQHREIVARITEVRTAPLKSRREAWGHCHAFVIGSRTRRHGRPRA